MKKLLSLIIGLLLIASACNKTVTVNDTPQVVIDTPTSQTLPTPSIKVNPPKTSGKVKVNDVLDIPTPEELAAKVDQNTIKNIEQDAKLTEHDKQINELNNKINTPTPTPTPQVSPPDTVAPIVSIQRQVSLLLGNDYMISNGGSLYGVIGLSGDICEESPNALEKFEYYLDGNLIATEYNLNGTIAWDTTKFEDGSHVLMAKVYDKAGNVGSDSATISIKNIKE